MRADRIRPLTHDVDERAFLMPQMKKYAEKFGGMQEIVYLCRSKLNKYTKHEDKEEPS